MAEQKIDPHNLDPIPLEDDVFNERHPMFGDPSAMTIALGQDCEAFLGSNIGQYLQAKSDEIVETCRDRLLTVDPDDTKAIRDLQFRAAVATESLQWLLEAAANGEAEYQARFKEIPDA